MNTAALFFMIAFSPCREGQALSAQQVQASLRTCFSCWGLPEVLRVDNGDPWGTHSLVPSALSLWCVGLGISVHVNPPRHCTDNGIVERCHGVAYQWSEPQTCDNVQMCQQHLDWACHMQREVYPAIAGQTRLLAYPGLHTNPRTYHEPTENQQWCLKRVGLFLEQFRFERRVDQSGRVSLFSQNYTVGRPHKGKTVALQFRADDWHWLVRDERGHTLTILPADNLSQATITGCKLTKHAQVKSHDAS